MNDKVDVNVDELERFLSRLKKFDELMRSETRAMNAALNALGGQWRDEKFRNFQAMFTETFKGLDHYNNRTPEYEKHLQDRLEAAKAFLGRR